MTLHDSQFLETWDSPYDRSVEAEINRLEDALDELTNAIKHRDGARAVQANRKRVKAALIKLRDLCVEIQPVGVAA